MPNSKLTFGAGGFALLGLYLSSTGRPSGVEFILWCVAALTPYLIVVPPARMDRSRGFGTWARPSLPQRIASVWYLSAFAGGLALAVLSGFGSKQTMFALGCLLGIWPCVVVLVRWRRDGL